MISRLVCILLSVVVLCQAKNYLVLGGNGLLGAELVSLLRLRTAHDITIVNRGNWYWDSKFRIKPYVTHVKCDRYAIKRCNELVKLIKEKGFFDMVYDFSSYRSDHLQSLLDIVRGHVGRYVYVSSDSVYEVCKPSTHGGPSREEDAIRYDDYTELKKQQRFDYYGNSKLECEEVLVKERKLHRLNYIILRLPDVIGPRDNTDRFWFYFLWVKFQDAINRPLDFPPRLHNQQLSMGFSEDIAMQMHVLEDLNDDVFNQAYNLAFKETVTLKEFLIMLGNHVGNTDLIFDETSVDGSVYFPSVNRGPVNTTKAEKMLKWQSIPLSDGVKKSANFYNYAMKATEFRQQRDGTVEAFVDYSKMKQFKKKFQEVYGQEFNLKYQLHKEL